MKSAQYVCLCCFFVISIALRVSGFSPPTISLKKTYDSNPFLKAKSLRLEMETNPFQGLRDMFGAKKAVTEKIPDVVIDPDFRLAAAFGLGGVVVGLGVPVLGVLPALLAILFAVQATRVRFVFDETSFELRVDEGGEELRAPGENIVVGGANRWNYDSFVNWEFFPSVDVPILVYFKETQTPEEKWNEGPGQLDKRGGGQVHFFPVICNAIQLKEQFEVRGCQKLATK